MTTSWRSLDLAKAAKLLGDIRASEQEADLSGVDVIDAEQGFLEEVGQQVREQAQVCCSPSNAVLTAPCTHGWPLMGGLN